MSAEFESLVANAMALMEAGQRDEALAVARKAETFSHDVNDNLTTLGAWNDLGIIFFKMGYSEAAHSAYSIAVAGKAHKEDVNLEASLYNNLGQVTHRLARLGEAQRHLTQAVSIRERTHPDSHQLAITLDNLGAVEHSLDNLDEAETLHKRAITIFTRSAGYLSTDVGTAIGNLGGLYEERRNFARAEACRLRAFYTHLRASGPLGSETLLNAQELCGLYLKLGRTADVDWLVEFLLAAGERQSGPGFRVLAEMLHHLARKTFTRFRLDLTERLVTRAVNLLESSEGPDSPVTLAARFQRASTRRALNNLPDAESEFTSLLERYGHRGDKLETVRTTIELAKTYRDRGANQPARGLLESAISKLQAKEVDNSELLASAYGNLAEVAHQENENEEARELYRSALEALDSKALLDWPWLTHGLATVEYHLGNYLDAARLYTDAKQRWTELYGAEHPFVGTCAANLALVHWSTGNATDAFVAFKEATTLRDDDVRRQLALGSERQRLEYARDQQGDLSKVISFCLEHSDLVPEAQEFATEVMLRRKSRVLDGVAHTLRQARGSTSGAVGDMLNRLLVVQAEKAQLSGPLKNTGTASVTGELRRLRREEEALESALSHEGALAEAGLEKVSLPMVRSAIPGNAVLIEYVRYKEFVPTRDGRTPWRGLRYAAAVLTSKQPSRWFDLGPAEQIDEAINTLRNAIDREDPGSEVDTIANRLIELLLSPMAELIKSSDRWLIAPDGLINLAPFDALLDTWLGLENAPLVSFLVTARDLTPHPETPTRTDVTVLAAPDFEAPQADPRVSESSAIRRGGGYEPLPGTSEEAQGVKQVFPSARVIMGRDATAKTLTDVHAPLILHIATHGVFEPLAEPETTWSTDMLPILGDVALLSRPNRDIPDPMVYSGLVFAGANITGELSGGGIVTAREIAGIDLLGTELVVLSACETGVGHIRDGEEFSGLRRAFAIAGAHSQLTSLWAVDDAATAALMVAFYEQIRAGNARSQALRTAQLMVKTEHPEWKHPVFWAAFELSGNWGPMQVPD